ncbi:hypothetical protein TRV_05488 [Trichophyton verrucosum HKI 0517]|uniref:Uncharacterized protein n=1 Tax=Trichophyton verrucosum (strain HKI 0517) TaxID=663202 RepID=D4DEC1_TRIVH|nr:uncharacterized protein TRV_05488 [Trichophyton verrucosum HKI 0517]EFE39811.1 hypothetical protein TRV_05488 [Trichophyton verrucosum HKI 0517]
MEEETEERKRRKKKTAGEEEATVGEGTWEVLRLQQAAAERHLSQEEENIRIKTWSRRDTKRCVVLFSLGIRGERGSEISHTAYLVRQLLFRTAYKAGWTASSTLLATLLALLSHLYRPVALKLSVNREEGPVLLLLLLLLFLLGS